jgi:hypothetical protein
MMSWGGCVEFVGSSRTFLVRLVLDICRNLRRGALVASALAACSSAPKPEGEGGPCQQVSDCAMGLVCVKGPNNTKLCSKDLSSIVNAAPAPSGDGGGQASGAGAGADAAE